jgi:ADP-ribose pyrophosphatase YjhB (NUDIX family)
MCHDGKGNYAFMRRGEKARDERGVWDCGGGALEQGDLVLERLRQEIREEYCTEAREIEFLGYRDVHREHQENGVSSKTHWIALDFRVLVDPVTVKIGEPHKFDEIGWFKVGEFPQPLHSTFPVILEKYKAKLI